MCLFTNYILIFYTSWLDFWNEQTGMPSLASYKKEVIKMMMDIFYDGKLQEFTKNKLGTEEERNVEDESTSNKKESFLLQQLSKLKKRSLPNNDDAEQVRLSLQESFKAELDGYINIISKINWYEETKKFPSSYYKEESVNKFKYEVEKDPIYIAKRFDTMRWWQEVGSKTFKHISFVALVIFGKPQHNAFQERVFSRGSFTDSALRRSMKENTFETTILESLNGDNVERHFKWMNEKNLTSNYATSAKEKKTKFMRSIQNESSYIDSIEPDESDDDLESKGEEATVEGSVVLAGVAGVRDEFDDLNSIDSSYLEDAESDIECVKSIATGTVAAKGASTGAPTVSSTISTAGKSTAPTESFSRVSTAMNPTGSTSKLSTATNVTSV
jgi:hypothetical protein